MREAERKQYDRQNAYNSAKYDRIQVMLPKGSKDKLKAVAEQRGLSVNALISEILRREIEL